MLENQKKEKIHTRTISISTFTDDETHLIVEGTLKDDRLVDYYMVSGEKHSPDTIHHLLIRIKIEIESFTIKDVEVKTTCVPHTECPEVAAVLPEKLRNLKVSPGFSTKVKKTFGGVEGCAHLTALLLAMAPAIVQGIWVHRARKPICGQLSQDVIETYLIDTCRVWRRDGKLAAEITKKGRLPDAG